VDKKRVQRLNKKKPIQLSPAEIRAVYAGGEEAVVELVTGLVEHIGRMDARLTELEGIVKKNSSNSSKLPSGDGFGKKTNISKRMFGNTESIKYSGKSA
jgi:transposase